MATEETSSDAVRWVSPDRKRRYNQPPCMMCKVYQTAPNKEKAKGVKFCRKSMRYVFAKDYCTADFEPAIYFYCPEYECQLNTVVCLHRRTPACKYGGYYDTCKKCEAGRSLFYYDSGRQVEYDIKGE